MVQIKKNYFNTKSAINILIITVVFLVIDLAWLDFVNDPHAFSKSFYCKLLLTVFYFVASKGKTLSVLPQKQLEAAYDYSIFYSCTWLGFASLIIKPDSYSSYMGIFVFVGACAAFLIIEQLINIFHLCSPQILKYLIVAEIVLKVFLFSLFILSFYLLATGIWIWDIKPFYEWY
ncbi:hypothetical protein C2869_16850 [Saccharobesus litoralis]|uniref:Uncharacterized protein n=1 Tax=Saccharobesus litoralis TaxID=2172099 RepID=A0A2S0VUV1_9ALTE|nr:hypothetical protein C2869_16850 [Saccharobesus litoralis]